MRIAILGGGVAGVVLARELANVPEISVTLYEIQPRLGGLHRSVAIDGLNYDIGAFLFDREHQLLKSFPVLYDHFVPVNHRSLVVTGSGTFDIYPMSMRGYLRDHGISSVAGDAIGLLASKFRCRQRDTLVAYIEYYLGKRIYRKSGLKAYIERFYATQDTDVDIEFALQRLSTLPQDCGLRRNFFRIVREIFDSRIAEQTWGCYVRPREGFPFAYSLIEQDLLAAGVSVRAGVRVERVERNGDGFLLHSGTREGGEGFDQVVSTIPIGTMLQIIGSRTERPPETIRLVSLCYRFQGDLGFSRANILYNFTYDARWKRMNLHSPLYGRAGGDEYFVVECTNRSDSTETEESYRKDFETHIQRLPILKGSLNYQGAIVTDNAYPFLRRNDVERVAEGRRTLEEFGIALTGRQGRFVYENSHTIALAAKALAREISQELT